MKNLENFDVFCSHCTGVELEHHIHKGTHIHVCPECPNVTIEYSQASDVANLAEFLESRK